MESLEDVDLAKSLNFSSALRFVELVEEDLAGLVLAAQSLGSSERCCRLTFPPLKPRYATLLQVTAARFGLKAALLGWGDERRVRLEASPASRLPAVQASDFRPGAASSQRLAARARPSPTAAAPAPPTAEAAAAPVAVATNPAPSAGGMQGWSDDDSEDDWIAKRRKANAAAGRVARGRGAQAESAGGGGGDAAHETEGGAADVVLQKDYSRYAIDPEDTWRPHRKPWVELTAAWEFSGAWSFEPDDRERHEGGAAAQRGAAPSRGIAVWRVEHGAGRGGDFAVAVLGGPPGAARPWLTGRGGGGEEPFVLEFRLDAAAGAWDFRFGRATKRQQWRSVPWSNAHRTSFWLAVLPGEDGKHHFFAGLDEFPERRFFFAKLRLAPVSLAFGPAAEARPGAEAFYIRDIAVFGRTSLLPPPFAGRDHFVEVADRGPEAAIAVLQAARPDLVEAVQDALELCGAEGAPGALLRCRSAAAAAEVAAAVDGAVAVRSSQWAWPPEDCAAGAGPEAAQAHVAAARDCWARLRTETTREIAIFEEHTERRTRHLEGVRIARASATRTILRNLRGAAPPPRAPEVCAG